MTGKRFVRILAALPPPLVLPFVLGAPISLLAHEGSAPELDQWIEKRLTVEHDSNWSTEHCLTLGAGHLLSYHFSADLEVNFDFHFHPKDGPYRTDHFVREKAVREWEGQTPARLVGSYCFDFVPVQRPSEDKEIRLTYRVSPGEKVQTNPLPAGK